MQDIILRNGVIYNGTENKPFRGDISIKNGIINEIAEKIMEDAETIIDLQGLAVSPGFIDIHSHSDTSFLRDDRCESKIYQGVTSEVVGQCGLTIYPCKEDKIENLYIFAGTDSKFDKRYYTSCSLEEFIKKAKKRNKKMSTNLLPLVGNCALRAGVVGFDNRKATIDELKTMTDLLERDIKYGAWGLSLGLGYSPGLFASQEELNSFGEVIKKYDGVITSHIRNQSDHIFEALDEMYEINRATGARVHIAHVKICGKEQLGTSQKVIEDIRNAVNNGIQVTKDMYPYAAASTGITNIMPKWSLEGGIEKAASRFNTEERSEIIKYLEENFKTQEDGESLYMVTTYGEFPIADNKNIYQLSIELGLSMAETIEKVIVETNGNVDCINFIMIESDVMNFLKEKDIAIGSDGYAFSYDEGIKPHPRSFGTFPKFLRLVRDKKICNLETAIYRMTKLSADIVGLKNRGVLKEGFIADITVFNPDTVTDTATYENPCSKPIGIEHVIINGQFAIYNRRQTDNRLGQILLKNK